MSYTLSAPRGNRFPVAWTGVCLVVLLLLTYWLLPLEPPPVVYAQATTSSGLTFDYEMITEDIVVDWSGSGFDPRGKCPDDFFSAGFVLLCKRLSEDVSFKFLYHAGRRLLFRIDRDVINGTAQVGLHWVTGTRFNAKYRIGDETFKGGKSVKVPNGKGGTVATRFHYGQAVSKLSSRYGRELFRPTHLTPDQCPDWWDIFNFLP